MKIGFYSTTSTFHGISWGGSEELWSDVALLCLKKGHSVTVNFSLQGNVPHKLVQIQKHGGKIYFRDQENLLKRTYKKLRNKLDKYIKTTDKWLSHKPDVVVISMAWHIHDLRIAEDCIRKGIPYVLILQSVSINDWIDKFQIYEFRNIFSKAVCCYFLSMENKHAMEMQLAINIDNYKIVQNPIKITHDMSFEWPKGKSYILACVGRIHFRSKGQDVLLQALREDIWKEREIKIEFYGEDQGNLVQLLDLIHIYGLQEKAVYKGHATPHKIWTHCCALILASRFEGLPIATVEALMAGRIPIVTHCASSKEFITDGRNGFIIDYPEPAMVHKTLERAWQARESWHSMGRVARELIHKSYEKDPGQAFYNHFISLFK